MFVYFCLTENRLYNSCRNFFTPPKLGNIAALMIKDFCNIKAQKGFVSTFSISKYIIIVIVAISSPHQCIRATSVHTILYLFPGGKIFKAYIQGSTRASGSKMDKHKWFAILEFYGNVCCYFPIALCKAPFYNVVPRRSNWRHIDLSRRNSDASGTIACHSGSPISILPAGFYCSSFYCRVYKSSCSACAWARRRDTSPWPSSTTKLPADMLTSSCPTWINRTCHW